LRGRVPAELFAEHLRLLIDIARTKRRVFVGRRMLDVAVHADGAALYDAANAGGLRLE